jgi:hypothetical protein
LVATKQFPEPAKPKIGFSSRIPSAGREQALQTAKEELVWRLPPAAALALLTLAGDMENSPW